MDTAKSAAGEAKSTTESATGGNPVDKAVGAAKSATSDIKSETESGGGGNPLEQAGEAAKSAAGDAGKPNFFQNFLGIDNKQSSASLHTFSRFGKYRRHPGSFSHASLYAITMRCS